MEARFAFLHQRDTSVSMMRVKNARRRSQSQKQNRERVHNLRRHLDNLPEQDSITLDASTLEKTVPLAEVKPSKVNTRAAKAEERSKMLARYKEAKDLQKEKERREREKKGVFKVGLYQPHQPLQALPPAPTKAKVSREAVQPARVTRSMRQPAPTPQPLKQKTAALNSAPKKEVSDKRQLNTRGQGRNTAASLVSVTKPKPPIAEPVTRPARSTRATAAATKAETKARSTTRQPKVSSTAPVKASKENKKEMIQKREPKEVTMAPVEIPPPQPEPIMAAAEKENEKESQEEAVVQAETVVPPTPSSFAPIGFVFQAPAGLPALQSVVMPPSSDSALPAPSLEPEPEPEPEPMLEESPPSPVLPSTPPRTVPSSPPPPPPPSVPSTPPPAVPSTPPPSVPAPSSPTPVAPATPAATSCPPAPQASSPPPPPASPSPPPASVSSPTPPSVCSSITSPPPAPSAAPAEKEGACEAAVVPSSQQEGEHDVPYFRAILVSETERLSAYATQWEPYFDDASIPEEMRDRMRTAVGQARLLMKERFGQFRGLVDDCEFKRGEKETTCTDLQGFWEMIYFQVEDVDRKFVALKEAQGRGWTEEVKQAPRPKKIVKYGSAKYSENDRKYRRKKPPGAAAASRPGGASNAAAKSRLAAIKAAMKAKQQQAEAEKAEAEKAAQAAAATEAEEAASTGMGTPALDSVIATGSATATPSKPLPQAADTITFNGGFFQVQSPAKPAVASTSRVSSRLSRVHAASPCPASSSAASSPLPTPSRARCSFAPLQPSPLVRRTPASTPARLTPAISVSPACTHQRVACTPSATPTRDNSTNLSSSPERVCPASPSLQLNLESAEDQSHCSSEAAPALSVCPQATGDQSPRPLEAATSLSLSETPRAPPSDLLSTLSTEQCLPGEDSHVSPAAAVRIHDTDVEMAATPETPCTEDMPGLDFERYLQQTAAAASPNDTGASLQAFSPMLLDAEMESPEPQRDQLTHTPTPTALPRMSPLFTPQMGQAAESNLLLFTPELKNRVRQSVCAHDLMSFTPPQ